MTGQEVVVLVIGLVAAAYVLVRFLRRRRAGACCGDCACPVEKAPRSRESHDERSS